MLSALLTGVNRAFPYSKASAPVYVEYLDLLFKVVDVASFNKSVQALQLVWQIMSAQEVSHSLHSTLTCI